MADTLTKKIGQVTLNYQFYKGEDLYSDGPIEDWLLNIARQGKMEDALWANNAWPILYHFTPVRQHIIEWYPMKEDAAVLEIGAGCGAVTGILSRMAQRVVCIELSEKRSLINAYQNQSCGNVEIIIGNYEDITLEEKFDYITLIGVLEYAEYYTHSDNPALDMLRHLKTMLKPDGKILIAIENRMGLKYINGACEDHTGGLFDGLYQYYGKNGVKTYTKPELENMLTISELPAFKFYYPLPDYKLPRLILSDTASVISGGLQGMMLSYDRDRLAFFDEDCVWDTLCRDGQLGYLSNSFFIEAGTEHTAPSGIDSVYYSYVQRNARYLTRTMLLQTDTKKTVLKTCLYPEGKAHIDSFLDNYQILKDLYTHMLVVPPRMSENGMEFPFVEGENLQSLLVKRTSDRQKLKNEVEAYLDKILDFNEKYLTDFHMTADFACVFGEVNMEGAPAVTVSNIDPAFSNIIERDGQLYCFDYEWVFSFPVPVRFIRYRILRSWYTGIRKLLPYKDEAEFFAEYGMPMEDVVKFEAMEQHFCTYRTSGRNQYGYFEQYYKNTISYEDISQLITEMQEKSDTLTTENKQLTSQVFSLTSDLQQMEKKLNMHLQNEDRLRKRLMKH